MPTLPQKINDVVKKHPQKNALGFKRDNQWQYYSYQEFWQRVLLVAGSLQDRGVVAGDRVAILSENRPEWAICDQATMLLGAAVVPLHTTLSAEYIKYILNDSGAKVLFISGQKLFNKAKDILGEVQSLTEVILFEKLSADIQGRKVDYLNDLLNADDEPAIDLPEDENSLASIVYTSGTTGEPKGVMLSHKNFVANIEAALRQVQVKKSDIFLSFLPLSHVLERTAGYYAPLCSAATICYAEDVSKLADNMKEVRPTILVSVPRIFEKVYEKIRDKVNQGPGLKKKLFYWALNQTVSGFKHSLADKLVYKKIRHKLGGRLRFSISGGASLNEKVARFFEKIGVIIVEGYGLTETSPVICCNKLDNYKFGTVGQALDNLEVKIMPDKEIAAKGPSIMLGYYNKEELTKEVMLPDDWFLTGDLGFIDQDGFLTIVGRKKEMITLANGKTIAPEKIEGTISLSEYVAQVLVIGHNKPCLTALVVPEWPALEKYAKGVSINFGSRAELARNSQLEEYILARVKEKTKNLPDYEQVKKVALIENEFSQERNELTPTLKLRREVIKHNYAKEVDALYR